MPKLYIIAGCNGAGKTTASYTILPEMLHCKEFVNADEIARGLSPFQPEKVALEAGRIMINRIQELLARNHDFAFETTLASKTHIHTIRKAKQLGYEIILVFIWLESPELAEVRVKKRVSEGGHNIPQDIIRRRYFRGLINLFRMFLPECNYYLVVNNSGNSPEVIVEFKDTALTIRNNVIWELIKSHGYEQ